MHASVRSIPLFYYSLIFMEVGRRQSLQSGGGRHIDAVLNIRIVVSISLEACAEVSEAVEISYLSVVQYLCCTSSEPFLERMVFPPSHQ